MLGLQGERNCEGAQTDLDGVPKAQEGKKNLKRPHRASKEDSPKGTEARLRDSEELISETEGQVSWRVEKWQKL